MTQQRKALVSGCNGQDGSYLCELLLSKGYNVHGIVRRSSNPNYSRIKHVQNLITLHQSDLLDQPSLSRLMTDIKPDEVYNLAAQSFVGSSWDQATLTAEVTAMGTLRMLEAIRDSGIKTRFYQASSSELFGKVQETPQKETTPFYPRSPYGVAKLYAHWITINYRESYDMFNVSGILYNHESERRGLEFVTRKISMAVARIKLGLQQELRLGNLDSKRDWSHASDMVNGMWLMLQQDKPDDFILASGETHSVREFLEIAFNHVGLKYEDYVVIDPKFIRPAEVDLLLGDPSKAKSKLGWELTISFEELVKRMVDNDLAEVSHLQ